MRTIEVEDDAFVLVFSKGVSDLMMPEGTDEDDLPPQGVLAASLFMTLFNEDLLDSITDYFYDTLDEMREDANTAPESSET